METVIIQVCDGEVVGITSSTPDMKVYIVDTESKESIGPLDPDSLMTRSVESHVQEMTEA